MSESYTWGDYYSRVGERDNEENRLEDLQNQKNRLIAAKDILEENKEVFNSAKQGFKSNVYHWGARQWKGSNFDSCNFLFSCIEFDYDNCATHIDDINDDLNWKIADLDLAIMGCEGNINALNYAINRIWTFLQNITN